MADSIWWISVVIDKIKMSNITIFIFFFSQCNYYVLFQEGITGTWFPAWILLQQRTLIYTKSLETAFAVNFEYVDLRKARCIGKSQLKVVIPHKSQIHLIVY